MIDFVLKFFLPFFFSLFLSKYWSHSLYCIKYSKALSIAYLAQIGRAKCETHLKKSSHINFHFLLSYF